jgi:hypothetical protein
VLNQTQIIRWAKTACCGLLICLLSIGLVSCGGEEKPQTEETKEISTPEPALTEVAPPAIFEELRQTIDKYQPQVAITSPKNGEIIEDTRVGIEVDVKDYPLFKNEELGMGPHLHVILDNEPYRAVYTADEPIIFEDLSPGTHTIRMFASRPWHESFKNEGAYAQVTFHLFTETADNLPDPEKPLLTYSRPKGTYGAEPILLDYYLTNAPIRLPEEDIDAINTASQRDWRVRATINGESFIMDSWLPVYLEGFNTGRNWIKLELLDGDGNLIENAFNTAARLFTYEPRGEDTLSQLVRGELTAEEARVIVDAEYEPPKEQPEEEEEIVEPEVIEEEPSEAVTEEEKPETIPEEEEEETTPEPAVTEQEETETTPEPAVTEQEETETTPEPAVTEQEESISEPETTSEQEETETTPEPAVTEQEESISEPEEEESISEPETTSEPAVTEQEESISEPETTSEQVVTEEEETGTTSEPAVTEQEESISEPETTSEQEITEQEESISEPETTSEQEETETTPEPAVTEQEESISEPETTSEQEETETTPEPAVTEQEEAETVSEPETTSEQDVTEETSPQEEVTEEETNPASETELETTTSQPEETAREEKKK